MRYSKHTGIAAVLLLIITCFTPWVYIPTLQLTITGFHTQHTNFGQPGLMHSILGGLALLFFLSNAIAAKRANVFVCTLNFAWAVRNYLLVTQCELGECPEKKSGIYIILLASFIILVMALLPPNKLNNTDK